MLRAARPGLLCSFIAFLAAGCGSEAHSVPVDDDPVVMGPVAMGQGLRIFSGRAAVLTEGQACTSEKGATGDRWCGFYALDADDVRSLYVVNVSQVLAGTPVTCDVPDPNCLLLTTRVGSSAANFHPTGFEGDTLVYYDETVSPYAWRPGMDRGRLLMSRTDGVDVIFCSPAPVGTAVGCLAVPREQLSSVVFADIYAGAADGESEPLLQPVESIIWASLTDVAGANRFRWGFPAPGYVAWSSPEVDDGPEILKMARVDDPASKTTVATNVHYWRMSGDSQWFWLSMADLKGNGLLQTAKFPDGEVSDVLADVRDYAVDAKGAVAALTVDGHVVSIPDAIGAPATQRSLDQGAKVLVGMSDDGEIAYGKNITGGKVVDLFTSKIDGSRHCTLDTTIGVPLNSFHFGPGTDAAVSALQNNNAYDAYHTRFADCVTEPVAPAVAMLSWVSRGTAMFVDEFDSWSASGSLRVRGVSKNGALDPAPPTLLAEHIGSFGTVGAVLLYGSSVGGEGDGLYIRAFSR